MELKVKSSPQNAIQSFLDGTWNMEHGTFFTAIVPNTRWVDEINKRILAEKRIASILGKRVYSIKEFVRENTAEFLPIISRSMQKFLLLNILKSTKTVYFRTISLGVVETFLNAITCLKKNGISAEELKKILDTRGGLKELDLLKVYQAYEDTLARHKWHDEENLYVPCSMFHVPVYLIGFERQTPWMENIFPDAVFFNVEPEKTANPKVFALNSPFAESKFIAEKIANLKIEPEKIAVYLPEASPFAWQIAKEFTNSLPFNINASKIMVNIFNNDTLPANAPLKEYIKLSLLKIESEVENLKQTDSDKYLEFSIRSFRFADEIIKMLKHLLFEAENIGAESNINKNEFLSLIKDEKLAWPENLPFRLIPWEDAGLYECEEAILPQFNEGIMPPSASQITFFSEPDTLSQKPDERIEQIFPRPEDVIKTAIRRLTIACSSNTVITYHLHNALGKDAICSPLIIKYPHTEINVPAIMPKADYSKTCGTNFKTPSALLALKKQMENMTFSATKLEKYASCAFTYFCRYILGIEPPDEITPEVQPKDRGTLIHKSLEEFFVTNCNIYNNSIKNNVPLNNLKGLVIKTVEKVFNQNLKITSKYHPDMVAHLKRRTVSYLTAVLLSEIDILKNSAQLPSYFELKFEDKLENDVPIKGVIDRIDTDDKTFTVIDYKTGPTDSVKNSIKKGLELQMPIYTSQAERILKKEPAAAFLYSIKKQKRATGIIKKELKENVLGKAVSRLTVSNEEWDELIGFGIKKAVEYAEKIRKGRFECEPDECKPYCDWKDVCRFYEPD